jgi:drug/metabolite transporter (DMT)-like permease
MLHTVPARKPSPFRLSVPEVALVAVTCFWGGTFLIVHLAMRECGPLFFVGVRFLTAGTASLLVFGRTMGRPTRADVGAGLAVGVAIACGYALQTIGLTTISSSQSAFLTALYVPMVPLLQWLVMKRPPGLPSWIGVAAAFVGMVLLAGPDAGVLSLSPGEIATVACAFAVAAEILLIGHFASRVDSRRVSLIQLYAGSALSFLAMPFAGEGLPAFSWGWVSAAVGLGFASAVIQLVMNWAQKSVSPTRATLIYAGEPVWGGLVGRVAGDALPPVALAGAALIVGGVISSGFDRRPAHPETPAAPRTAES